MVTDLRETNRNYQIPAAGNKVSEEFPRLALALQAIGIDIKALIDAVGGKAPTVHTHSIAQITSLQTALDGKASTGHQHALGDLTDVVAPGPSEGQALRYVAGKWQPATLGTMATEDAASYTRRTSSVGATQLPSGTTAQRPTGVAGMIRWNSSLNRYEGYDGSSWNSIGGGETIRTIFSEVATTSKTVFSVTGGYIPVSVLAFLNGMPLMPGTDYAATDGLTVVLTEACSVDDHFFFIAFDSFRIADALAKTLNLSDVLNPDTALTNLGGTGLGKALFKSASQAAALSSLGVGGVGVLDLATKAEAEAGTANKGMDALRTSQAISAQVGWRQIGTTVTVSSAVSEVIFKDFGAIYRELSFISSGVRHNSGSDQRIIVYPSVDNGSTWLSSYFEISGVSFAGLGLSEAVPTADYSDNAFHIFNVPDAIRLYLLRCFPYLAASYVRVGMMSIGTPQPINAMRIRSSGGSLIAGTIRLYGRQ